MFWITSSPKHENVHFASCSADGGETDPIGLGKHRPLQPGLENGHQRVSRETIGKAVAGGCLAQTQRVQLSQGRAEQPRRRGQLADAKPQIRAGDPGWPAAGCARGLLVGLRPKPFPGSFVASQK